MVVAPECSRDFRRTHSCAAQPQNFPNIPEIAAHAGIIFRGTVLAVVTETPRAPGEVAAKRVTFRVEEGIRGAAAGHWPRTHRRAAHRLNRAGNRFQLAANGSSG